MLFTIQLILSLLQGLLPMLTSSNAPAELIAGVQRAIEEIRKVHSTVVTKAQVDSLLDQPKW